MLNHHNIVFLDRATLPGDIQFGVSGTNVDYQAFDRTTPSETASRIGAATIIITNKVSIGKAELDAAPCVKMIVVAATGTDCIDIPACTARGIKVCNVRDYARETVPEHVFSLILSLRRSIGQYHASVQKGRWQDAQQFCYFDFPITNLAGSVLGVVGSGSLGRRVGELGAAFGMKVIYSARKNGTAPSPTKVSFDDLLKLSDIISLHLPLTKETRNLLSRAEFDMMERKPIIINTARGPLIDEAAMLSALQSGRISGAGIDVAMPEPPPLDSPLMEIAKHPRAIVTPHVAWAGWQSIQELADQVSAMVSSGMADRPFNVINE